MKMDHAAQSSLNRGLIAIAVLIGLCAVGRAEQIPLRMLVAPSTVISKDGRTLTFAIHGFIEFNSLADSFPYIEKQTARWKNGALEETARQRLARDLVREAVESRVISMVDERPLEALVT